VFFFQAEDGIRALVRSRGLGDVYKRQAHVIGVRPTNNPTREHISHRGQIPEPSPRGDIGVEVGPQRRSSVSTGGFCGPLSEPDVQLSLHPALHVFMPWLARSSMA